MESDMNKKFVATCALAAAVMGSSAALAQMTSPNSQTYPTTPGTMSTPDRQMSPGTMQGQMQGQGHMQGQMQRPVAPVVGPTSTTVDRSQLDLKARSGPEQREMELVQTSLLNRFGGMGFAEMRNFRKVGVNYAAEVRTVEGVWVNVLIDPATGAVTVQQ